MIPSLTEILAMLVKGECTAEQAEQWIGSHIDLATQDQALRDHFATTASIARDSQGNLLTGSVEAVMGTRSPPSEMYDEPGAPGAAKRFDWWCTAEARIRYAKAEAMLAARVL